MYVVAAKRTPFGAFGGKLKHLSANELGGHVAKSVVSLLPKTTTIDSIVFGNVIQTSGDAAYLARHIGHRANVSIDTPALTINRLCGSGFQAIINACQEIKAGDASVVLTGGTESMSQAPYAIRNSRWGSPLGVDLKAEDVLAHALVDQFPTPTPMGITAETLAAKYNISRHQCDAYALQSQNRWAAACQNKVFTSEIDPVHIPNKKTKQSDVFDTDEHPRPSSTLEALSGLKSVFVKNNQGVVTAGNASGISDGAAALVIASEAAVHKYGLNPLSRIVSYSVVGVDPSIMGIGPVPAMRNALARANLSVADMDLIEVNEAFAAQCLAVIKELNLDLDKTNISGGAIAMGHPLAASGARIMAHLSHALANGNAKFAIGSACIGGGQGIAIVLERV